MSKSDSFLPFSETLGEHFQCREILSGLVLTLLVAKSIQYVLDRCKRESECGARNVNNNFSKQSSVGASQKVSNYAAYYSLPGPKPFLGLRFIGNVYELVKSSDMMVSTMELAQKYGDIFRFTILGQDYVFLNSPQAMQAILSSNENGHLAKGGLEEMLWPKNVPALVILPSKEWRVRRKMLDRSFTYKSLQQYNPCFNRHSERLLVELEKLSKSGEAHTIDGVVSQCVLRATSETLMGVIFTDEEAAIFCESTQTLVRTGFQRVYSPWLYPDWIWRLHPSSRKCEKMMGKMAEVSYKVIKEHLDNMTNNKLSSSDEEGSISGNVVDVMLQHGLSEQDIFHEVAALLAIGHDTTSLSIVYALFLLALNPHHQKMCQNEIDAVFSDPLKYKDGTLKFHALADLKYLERCIFEAQRIYSLASTMRKLETPLRINEELVLPAGVIAVSSALTLHMNPKYFPNPEEFDPDRFLSDEVKARHPYVFLPFSKGPRNCVGMKLALVELKVALAKILHTFEVTTTDKMEDVRLIINGLPRPAKPINFIFKKRENGF